MKKITTLLTMSLMLILTACSDDDNSSLNLTDKKQKEQKLLADETSAKVSFTADDSWTATVTTPAATRMNLGSGGTGTSSSWITLDKYSGSAGSVTLNITLGVNYTGAARTGTVTIACGDDKITITIRQDAVDAGGKVPENTDNVIVDNKLVLKASDITGIPSSAAIADVRLLVWDWDSPGLGTVATAKWDSGFTLVFPETLASKYLASLDDLIDNVESSEGLTNELSVSKKNVKISDFDAELIAADASNTYLGNLFIGKASLLAKSTYVYADADCEVTGRVVYDQLYGDVKNYKLDLKKGWNTVYITSPSDDSQEKTYSTTKPSGTAWMFANLEDE